MSASKDPRKDAQEYIKEKRVDVLFQELGERLVFDRPENLNEYLLSVLQSMKKNKAEGQSTCFFTNEATSIATPDRQTDRQTDPTLPLALFHPIPKPHHSRCTCLSPTLGRHDPL